MNWRIHLIIILSSLPIILFFWIGLLYPICLIYVSLTSISISLYGLIYMAIKKSYFAEKHLKKEWDEIS